MYVLQGYILILIEGLKLSEDLTNRIDISEKLLDEIKIVTDSNWKIQVDKYNESTAYNTKKGKTYDVKWKNVKPYNNNLEGTEATKAIGSIVNNIFLINPL